MVCMIKFRSQIRTRSLAFRSAFREEQQPTLRSLRETRFGFTQSSQRTLRRNRIYRDYHMKRVLTFGLLIACVSVAFSQNRSGEPIPPMPKLLSQREQADTREQWLRKRLGSL